MYKAYVFDAYGTLFDVHSAVSRHFDIVGENPARVSEVWRNKQLEYTWVRTTMDRYKDFWQLTAEALDFALAVTPGSNLQLQADIARCVYDTGLLCRSSIGAQKTERKRRKNCHSFKWLAENAFISS